MRSPKPRARIMRPPTRPCPRTRIMRARNCGKLAVARANLTAIGFCRRSFRRRWALPWRSQEELLDSIRHSIYNQPPIDVSNVNLGTLRAVPEVKETVNLATQYMKAGYDPQAFIARLAEIVCHDNFTEMHAFKHHQSIVEEYHATHEPWRWMHLVCGAQAAAISFGKSMTVYEEYLELLHAA